jgi:hypothetical protein
MMPHRCWAPSQLGYAQSVSEKITHRIVVDVDSVRKTLMTIAIRSNGDLVLDLKSAEKYSDFGVTPEEGGATMFHNRRIKFQKYSIHTSAKSVKKINVIKQTFLFDDGSSMTFNRQYTKAIKQTRLFAPIYFRLVPDLKPTHYGTSRIDESNILIGDMSSKFFTMFCCALVSHRSRFFEMYHNDRFDFIGFPVGEFRITFLWSFIPFPPPTPMDCFLM